MYRYQVGTWTEINFVNIYITLCSINSCLNSGQNIDRGCVLSNGQLSLTGGLFLNIVYDFYYNCFDITEKNAFLCVLGITILVLRAAAVGYLILFTKQPEAGIVLKLKFY